MRLLRMVFLGVALFVLASSARAETRVALVIGNSNYANATTLANPGRDADAIAIALRAVGFAVDERKNVGSTELRGAILAFAQRATGADVAVVYYAGHGVQVDGINYLIPVDAVLASAAGLSLEAIPADAVLNAVERAHRLRLLILDACRENPFKAQLASMGNRAINRGLAPIATTGLGDTLVAYSAKDGTVAADGSGANSPFAAALATRLTEKGTEIDRMFREVRDDVLASTGNTQEPFVYGSRSSSDFYFAPGAAAVSSAPAQQPVVPTPVDPQAMELALWNSVANSNDAAQLQTYLRRYPSGTFADTARAKLVALSKPPQAAAPLPRRPSTPVASVSPDVEWTVQESTCDEGVGQSAISACTVVINSKRYPSDRLAQFYMWRGNRYGEDLKQQETAIQDYIHALALKPDYMKAYYNRGVAFGRLGQHERAIEDYDKALQLDPSYTKAIENRSIEYGALGKPVPPVPPP